MKNAKFLSSRSRRRFGIGARVAEGFGRVEKRKKKPVRFSLEHYRAHPSALPAERALVTVPFFLTEKITRRGYEKLEFYGLHAAKKP